jgi:hypothetical protein
MNGTGSVEEGVNALPFAQAAQVTEPTPVPGKPPTIEEQLAFVIRSAQDVAIVAEELLREFVALEASTQAGNDRSVPHAIVLAPRLLSATQQQLTSLLAMMKTI